MHGEIELTVLSLGTPVRIVITGEDAEQAASALTERWQQAFTTLQPTRRLHIHFTHVSGGDHGDVTLPEPDRSVYVYVELARMLDAVSSLVTLEGIEARSHDLLLLHATGLADPVTGLTVACVAASGTGKTTLARAAAGVLDYVSDETVGVAVDGSVVRYPKPLSVKPLPLETRDAGSKEQWSPSAVGLQVSGFDPLRLARVVLLDRAEARSATPVTIETVDTIDAIVAMVPELSYLGRLDKPLQRIAGLLEATGGALRVSYSEADEVVGELAELLLVEPGIPSLVHAPTVDTLEYWASEMAVSGPPEGDAIRYRAAPISDLLIDEASGRAVVFTGERVLLVNTVAAALVWFGKVPVTAAGLRGIAVSLFGEPPETEGGDVFEQTVGVLVTQGLLVAVPEP